MSDSKAPAVHMRPARITEAKVHIEGSNVQLIVGGRLAFDANWRQVERIARVLLQQCRIVEQREQMQRTVLDQAILTRTGAPIGLLPTHNPAIVAEVAREAQHNADLRKYLPGGIKSQEMVYAPAVVNHGLEEKRDA